jgi:protein arginine N-methyltransferase 1
MTYSLFAYDRMATDGPRMDAFARALQQVIRPGATVLDIGTGTGVCALLACRFGAGRVIAVEPDVSIEVARENAARNGLSDRVEFIARTSQEVALAERADVIVSDLRGVLPWFTHHLPAIADARTRLLAPGGVLVGARDRVWAAAVDLGEAWAPWEQRPPAEGGLDVGAGLRYLRNTPLRVDVPGDALVSSTALVADIDYMRVGSPHARHRFQLTAQRDGMAHGMAAWLEAELAEGVIMSSAPGSPPLIYGQLFFPWSEPVHLHTGDVIDVDLRGDLVGDAYVWTWRTTVHEGDDAARVRARFDQSTFLGQPLSAEYLARGRMDATPALGTEGRIELAVLSAMDGATTLAAIAEQLLASFPLHFSTEAEALDRAASVARRHGR